jgi:3-dehydroquinate synthetase
MLEFMSRDKKNVRGELNLVLPAGLGDVRRVRSIDRSALLEVLA